MVVFVKDTSPKILVVLEYIYCKSTILFYYKTMINQQEIYYILIFVENSIDGVSIHSTGKSAFALNGWYKRNLFGDYVLYTTDAGGNKVYQKTSGDYFLKKSLSNGWIVSSDVFISNMFYK